MWIWFRKQSSSSFSRGTLLCLSLVVIFNCWLHRLEADLVVVLSFCRAVVVLDVQTVFGTPATLLPAKFPGALGLIASVAMVVWLHVFKRHKSTNSSNNSNQGNSNNNKEHISWPAHPGVDFLDNRRLRPRFTRKSSAQCFELLLAPLVKTQCATGNMFWIMLWLVFIKHYSLDPCITVTLLMPSR